MIRLQQHINETSARAEVVRVCRALALRGYVSGWAGNVSARLDGGRVLLTPSGVPKSEVRADQLLVVDLRGDVVSAPPGMRPTSELPMHLCAYRRRKDVNAVVHAHPVQTVALSVVGRWLERSYVPEALVVLGPIAVTPYATPGTAENERVLDAVIANHDAIVLRSHGSVTVGRTLAEAYLRLETLEHTSRIVAAIAALGGAPELDAAAIAKLRAQRAKLLAGRAAPTGALTR